MTDVGLTSRKIISDQINFFLLKINWAGNYLKFKTSFFFEMFSSPKFRKFQIPESEMIYKKEDDFVIKLNIYHNS